ncbi:hypothetical protein LVJ94_32420 [Pendulispora rubella]|uniref:Uncharacterized protein n=1 Tax=Pendulispora rubella TaxID=2741070 RepID=A0ABZ2KSH4_9BACT
MSPTAIPEDPLEVTQTTAPAFLELGGKSLPIARPPRPRQAPNTIPAAAPTAPDSRELPDSREDPGASGKIRVQGKSAPPLPPRKGLMPLPRVSAPPAPPSPPPALAPSVVIDDSSDDLIDPGDDENATIPLPMEAVRQQLGSRPSWPPLPPLPALPVTSPNMARDATPIPPPAPGSPRPPSFGGSITMVGPPRPARRPPPAQAGFATPVPHPYLPPPPPPSSMPMPMPPPVVHPIDLESMTAPARYRQPMATVRREPLGARAGAPTLGRIGRALTDALSHPVLRSRGACAALGVLAGISIAVLYSEMTQPDLTGIRPEVLQQYLAATAAAAPPPAPVPKAAPKPIPKVPQHIGVVMPEDETPAPSAAPPR